MRIWKTYRRWWLAGVALTFVVASICAHLWLVPWMRWEKQTEDLRARHGRCTPHQPDFVFLAIDPTTFAVGNSYYTPEEIAAEPLLGLMMGEWPWPRSLYAAVAERLVQAGAKRILIDILFQRTGRGDEALAQVIDKYPDRIILAANLGGLEQVDERGTRSGVQLSLPAPSILPSEDPADPRLGLVNFWPDPHDSVVRQTSYAVALSQLWQASSDLTPPMQGEPILYSLAGRVLFSLGMIDKLPRQCGQAMTFRFTGPPGSFTPHPLHTVLSQKMWEHNFASGAFFRDKIVIIGPLGNFFKDEVMTPFGMFPGPELHLHALNAAWHGEFLQTTPPAGGVAIIALAGAAAWALCFAVPRAERRVGMAGLAALIYAIGLMGAHDYLSLFLPALAPLACFLSTTLAGFTFDFVLERAERARTRATFERYVSRNVVSDLLDKSEAIGALLGGQRKPITILFSDIRGFTTMTEHTDSVQLVAQLNEYLTAMVHCVFEEGGTLDKFIGDAVMAVWGNVFSESPATDATRAVRCAVRMIESLDTLNRGWEAKGLPPLHIGIGLNHGDAIVGNMGSPQRMEFTVIGDAVNLASRIESLTKRYGAEILLGEGLAGLVADAFHLLSVDLVQVKGKSEPVELFRVMGEKSTPLPALTAAYVEALATAQSAFRSRAFAQARTAFETALQLRPHDPTASLFIPECHRLIETPPDPSWRGVRIMTEK